MAQNLKTFIALLRGINVGGHNKIPMAELRELCAELGWNGVQSYIQSGNLVFAAEGMAASLEAQLEAAIADQFGFGVTTVVRDAAAWPAYVASNPYLDAAVEEPNLLMMVLAKQALKATAGEFLCRRADAERVAQVGDVLWIHYAGGGRSKLTPAVLERAAGSPVTARNWRTVRKLEDMAGLGAGVS